MLFRPGFLFGIYQVEAVTVHATQKYFVSASKDNSWCFYDIPTGSCLTQVCTPLSLSLTHTHTHTWKSLLPMIPWIYHQHVQPPVSGWWSFRTSGIHICIFPSRWSYPRYRNYWCCCQNLGCEDTGMVNYRITVLRFFLVGDHALETSSLMNHSLSIVECCNIWGARRTSYCYVLLWKWLLPSGMYTFP
jgi:hypothetical protein